MKRFAWFRAGLPLLAAMLVVACAGTPVKFDPASASALRAGSDTGRLVTAEACGFQLLLFIPIGVNSRLERAYDALKPEAGGSPLVDIEVAERWTYGLVGTQYCTALRGRVLTQGTS